MPQTYAHEKFVISFPADQWALADLFPDFLGREVFKHSVLIVIQVPWVRDCVVDEGHRGNLKGAINRKILKALLLSIRDLVVHYL